MERPRKTEGEAKRVPNVNKVADSFFSRFFENDPRFLKPIARSELEVLADEMIKNERLRQAMVDFFNKNKGINMHISERPETLFDSEVMELKVRELEKIVRKRSGGNVKLKLKYTPSEEW